MTDDVAPSNVRPTAALAAFASGLRLDDVPAEVIAKTKLLILDAIGCMVAGLSGEEVAGIGAVADVLGREGPCTALGRGQMSAGAATLFNGYLISASTAMDSYSPAACHMTPEIVPPALAMAEQMHLTGAAFLESIVVGLEVGVRVAQGLNYADFRSRGWHAPGVVGPFGGAAAAGHLLRLDPLAMVHALGLAGSQAAGTYAAWGTPTVKFHQARGALSGLLAATLANEGFASSDEILNAPDGGLYPTYSGGGLPGEVVRNLKVRWSLEDISMRRWPGPHNSVVAIILSLRAEEDVRFDDVEFIEVTTPLAGQGFRVFDAPTNRFQAMNSMPHQIAIALREGELGPRQFDAQAYLDPDVVRFRSERVSIRTDPVGSDAIQLSIRMKDGKIHDAAVRQGKGTPASSLTERDVESKFREACGSRLDGRAIHSAIDDVHNLETVTDAGALIVGISNAIGNNAQ